MKLSLIVAMAQNRAIGINNTLPWHLSADLKRFKQITLGKPILMGRNTHESIGKPLPGRENIVISRNPNYLAQGCHIYTGIEQALAAYEKQTEEIMIIGGVSLYQVCLPIADQLYLTLIHQDFDADTWFPEYQHISWKQLQREDINDDPQVSFSYSFIHLQRKD